MTELDFALINYELNRTARQHRRVRLWVVSNVLGTLLGLAIIWIAIR